MYYSYHKFTRGKDVKKYSSKDLANIFGKKELKDGLELSNIEETEPEVVEEPTGSKDTTGGVLTVKGGNIDEYFKNKLPNFMKKGDSNVQVGGESSEEEYRPHFGFGFDEKCKDKDDSKDSGFAFANEGLDLDYPEEGSKPKRRKVDFAYDNPCLKFEKSQKRVDKCVVPFSKEGFVNPGLNLTELTNDDNNGAEFEVSRVEFGVDNDALDISDEEGRRKRVTFNDKVEYNTDVIKRKKGKAKGKLDKFEVENNKLKRKSKAEKENSNEIVPVSQVAGFFNEGLDVEVISEEINDNEMNERKTKKAKRKKKNRRESNLETIEEAAEEESPIYRSEVGEAILLDENSPKRTKVVEKISNVDSGQVKDSTESCEEEKRVKKKKKKSKKKESDESLEKTRSEEQANDESQFETLEATEGKKKSKKKSKAKSKEVSAQLDIVNSGSAVKRKNSGDIEKEESTKKKFCKVEDVENVSQNGDTSLNSTTSSFRNKKGKTPKKIFKSLFAKAPTLYFSGANINEMAGYGADFKSPAK